MILSNYYLSSIVIVNCYLLLFVFRYIDGTVQNIIEAWETVLLEMDNKLTRYANHRLPNNLSADFLELLVFGYASNEIEEFLIRLVFI